MWKTRFDTTIDVDINCVNLALLQHVHVNKTVNKLVLHHDTCVKIHEHHNALAHNINTHAHTCTALLLLLTPYNAHCPPTPNTTQHKLQVINNRQHNNVTQTVVVWMFTHIEHTVNIRCIC